MKWLNLLHKKFKDKGNPRKPYLDFFNQFKNFFTTISVKLLDLIKLFITLYVFDRL